MAHQITSACVPCDACLPTCPYDAIVEGREQYHIEPDACHDCLACVYECPLDAVIPVGPRRDRS